jgi:hypothetical protein
MNKLKKETNMTKCNVNVRLLLGVFLIAIFIQGCATRVPVTKTKIIKVPEFTLNQKDSTPLTQKGLSIKVKPIHGKDIKQYPQFTEMLHYSGYEIKRVYSYKYKQNINKKVPYSGSFNIPLFPLPAFEVSITNNTNHVIKFSNATLAIEDSNGNLFDVLSKQDLPSYLQEAIRVNLSRKQIPRGATVDNQDQLFADQRQVKLIDKNFKVLPGRTTKGYLAFNYGRYTTKDFNTFVFAQQNLNVQLFELPIKVDKAANVLETTSFSMVFNIKIHEKEVQYTTYEWKTN